MVVATQRHDHDLGYRVIPAVTRLLWFTGPAPTEIAAFDRLWFGDAIKRGEPCFRKFCIEMAETGVAARFIFDAYVVPKADNGEDVVGDATWAVLTEGPCQLFQPGALIRLPLSADQVQAVVQHNGVWGRGGYFSYCSQQDWLEPAP